MDDTEKMCQKWFETLVSLRTVCKIYYNFDAWLHSNSFSNVSGFHLVLLGVEGNLCCVGSWWVVKCLPLGDLELPFSGRDTWEWLKLGESDLMSLFCTGEGCFSREVPHCRALLVGFNKDKGSPSLLSNILSSDKPLYLSTCAVRGAGEVDQLSWSLWQRVPDKAKTASTAVSWLSGIGNWTQDSGGHAVKTFHQWSVFPAPRKTFNEWFNVKTTILILTFITQISQFPNSFSKFFLEFSLLTGN